MCPVCMTTTALVAAGTTSGAGVLGFVAVRFRWLQRRRHRTVPKWSRDRPVWLFSCHRLTRLGNRRCAAPLP